jgi:peptidyl-prolyl cis-trans isomerase D
VRVEIQLPHVFLGVPEGYAVVRVNKLPRDTVAQQQAQQELQQYNRAWGTAEAMAYYVALKSRFKTQINVPRPAGGATQ